jgi:hypothetical protein
MAKTAKTTAVKKQSIGTTLKSLTQNFGALARDAQLVALMELTNLYKRSKATAVKKVETPAKKKVAKAVKTVKKAAKKTAKKKKS